MNVEYITLYKVLQILNLELGAKYRLGATLFLQYIVGDQ